MFVPTKHTAADSAIVQDEINITRLLDPALRGSLPKGFLHGYASASYQIEGGYDQGGRGLSKWDVLLKDTEHGEEACDSYHLWEEDVGLLVQYGVTAYRFSIAWPRIIPKGGKDDPVNQDGIDYYNKLIDALLAKGITPLVTLFHWDMPLPLEDKYGGFTASKQDQPAFLADFVNYARVCFEAFGDRVKNWITINEPQIYSLLTGAFLHRETYDPDITRWILARNLILGHAQIVDFYRRHFQPEQKGRIGITLNIEYCEPYDDTPESARAASRALDVHAGLFADPIYKGRINPYIQEKAGDRFEDFTPEEWTIIRGSSDFFGLNHYSTRWYTSQPIQDDPVGIKASFGDNEPRTEREDGTPIGFRGHNGHPYTVPWGFYKLLHYVSDTWAKGDGNVTGKTVPIIITENGFSGPNEGDLSLEERVKDVRRQEYFDSYIERLVQARREGVEIEGYMGWSLLDNLEWSMGYGPRFGVTCVDRENGFKRTPKNSALYLARAFKHLKGE